ncbi:MAG TPA: conjugal transfer protein TrbF [Acidothermaceae bacterium]
MRLRPSSWEPAAPLDTPYRRARQEWDRRIGGAVVQASNWRRATFAVLAVVALEAIGLVVLGAQPKAVPHLIQVDKLGAAAYLGPLERASLRDFQPPPASFEYHLRRFVSDTREISSDVAVVQRNWLDAYRLVTQNGANQLNAYVRDHDPISRSENKARVSVQVDVVVPISRESWQVDWTETLWDEHGGEIETSAWRATFRIVLRIPQTDAELKTNPIGLYIDEVHWARLADGRNAK